MRWAASLDDGEADKFINSPSIKQARAAHPCPRPRPHPRIVPHLYTPNPNPRPHPRPCHPSTPTRPLGCASQIWSRWQHRMAGRVDLNELFPRASPLMFGSPSVVNAFLSDFVRGFAANATPGLRERVEVARAPLPQPRLRRRSQATLPPSLAQLLVKGAGEFSGASCLVRHLTRRASTRVLRSLLATLAPTAVGGCLDDFSALDEESSPLEECSATSKVGTLSLFFLHASLACVSCMRLLHASLACLLRGPSRTARGRLAHSSFPDLLTRLPAHHSPPRAAPCWWRCTSAGATRR